MNQIKKYKEELLIDILILLLSMALWFVMFNIDNRSLIVIYFFLSSMFFGIGLYCFIDDAVKLNKLLKE